MQRNNETKQASDHINYIQIIKMEKKWRRDRNVSQKQYRKQNTEDT